MNFKYSLEKPIATILLLILIIGMSACSSGDSNVPETNEANNTVNVSSDISNNENDTNAPASNSETKTSDNRTNDTDAISFKYLYRGFTAVMLDDTKTRVSFDDVAGDRVILTEDDWHSFMEKYCPGIAYYNDVDFTSECLITITSMNAKPIYAISSPIRSINFENDTLHIEYSDDPSTYIYALNTDTVTHFFISVLIVNKSDLPNNVSDDWVYTK